MPLINCKNCGSLFTKLKSDYCPECQEVFDDYYRKVRTHLKENPRQTIWDLHVKLDIPVSVLQLLLNENYIPFNT